jgi:hypothetical protein
MSREEKASREEKDRGGSDMRRAAYTKAARGHHEAVKIRHDVLPKLA